MSEIPPSLERNAVNAAAELEGPRAAQPRSRLFRKYAVLFAALVGGALLASGAMQHWFSYQDNQAALVAVQREKALAAAAVIEQFVKQIENQIGWVTPVAFVAGAGSPDQRRADFLRLLRQAPAITEVAHIDASGKEQLRVSRLAIDVLGSQADFAADPRFVGAKSAGVHVSPIYFRSESEPYMSVAIAAQRRQVGVVVAEVNLKFIWDVISRIKVGKVGYAYAVDSRGLLIAHPDIGLVLRKTDLSRLEQVAAAKSGTGAGGPGSPALSGARDVDGHPVLTTHAEIASLGWYVFVQQPLSEAFEPLYASLLRTSALLVIGLAMAILASLLLARRMVVPIKALQAGAAWIGAGEFNRRIEVSTGDEIEELAQHFNRMAGRLAELDRLGRLRRFLSPQVADLIVSGGANLLESHRREITVVFCDLRGFTAFAETAEPEEVMGVLREYHAALGALIFRYEGPLERFMGDGLMVLFNDPIPCPDPAARAVRMAVAMREQVALLSGKWRVHGHDLGFGVGIAQGYATLGRIGFEGRFDYGSVGSVSNLGARLCAEAQPGQILISRPVQAAVDAIAECEPAGELTLKGFHRPVAAYNVLRLKP
jgi:class 3 adenylate cyclase